MSSSDKNVTFGTSGMSETTDACPLSGVDVHWPGDEGFAEAASPSLTPRGQAGATCQRGVRAALHPRHGSHCYLLHAFTKCSL